MNALSADGRCKSFAADADGYGRGEGFSAILLETLSSSSSLADGSKPRAIIAGSAVNQDGRSSGLTAPHGPSQQALISTAMAVAGCSVLGFVATHGTGTPLGDPIESGALRKAVATDPAAAASDGSVFIFGAIKALTGHQVQGDIFHPGCR